ncbi:hypothetical protein ISN44_As06g039240 [Arabidopsis suecica]|uniref:Uncharacterized protein n=1 Tax=Arabidopsis suecica TaxID=45249 RepID=A0A8T2CN26_ARASU|nr:hypothetical protein ISN44_As06g039240 [Arabidopsis suecica]
MNRLSLVVIRIPPEKQKIWTLFDQIIRVWSIGADIVVCIVGQNKDQFILPTKMISVYISELLSEASSFVMRFEGVDSETLEVKTAAGGTWAFHHYQYQEVCLYCLEFVGEVSGSTFESHHEFDAEYGFHLDDSKLTSSVSLSKISEGRESYFKGTRCKKHDVNTDTKPEGTSDSHTPGQAVLCHGARATTSGHGANMSLWSRSSAFTRDEKISEGILKLVRKAKLDSWCQRKGFHVDDSEITWNVCLSKQLEGGDLYFRGKHANTYANLESHIPGQVVLHRGARATTSGHGVKNDSLVQKTFV